MLVIKAGRLCVALFGLMVIAGTFNTAEAIGPFRKIVARKMQALRPSQPRPAARVQPAAQARPAARTPSQSGPLGLRETIQQVWSELQVYGGKHLERASNFKAFGRSDFDTRLSVASNLEALVKERNLPHYYAKVKGRDVLHLVVDLASNNSKAEIRAIMKRVGQQTVELNHKAPTKRNRYGHVAVRVGDAATYDLTGTQGVVQPPPLVQKFLRVVQGSNDATFARRRSLRRFFEARTPNPTSSSIYYGYLFKATESEQGKLEADYETRLKEATAFAVSGGNAAEGVFSCAQFLTEGIPFLNDRGIASNIGASRTATSARNSTTMEAVVVYKMPSVQKEDLRGYPKQR
jgi:hypothetical protein